MKDSKVQPKARTKPVVGTPKLGPYITQCKYCHAAVFQNEPHRWYRRPMGVSHIACAEEAGDS